MRKLVLLAGFLALGCKGAPPPVSSAVKDVEPASSSAQSTFPSDFSGAVPWRASSHGMRGALCRGKVWLDGHLAHPYDRYEVAVERRYGLHEASGRLVVLEQATSNGQTYHGRAVLDPERYLLEDDGKALTLSQAELSERRADALRFFPEAFASELFADMHEVRASTQRQRLWWSLDREGEPARILHAASPDEWLVSRPRLHPVLGEVVVEERFIPSANAVHLIRTERGQVSEDVQCEPLVWSDAEAAELVAATLTAASPDPTAHPISAPEIDSVAPGLFVARYTAFNNRSLIIERRDDLVVVEAPVSSEATEGLLAALLQRWPNKAVAQLIVTHHHPDDAGGIRPFIARDIPIVTTPGNLAYFEDVARADFHRAPDRLWREPRRPRFVTVNARHEISDGDVRIELFDVGAETTHTAEYLIAYLPHAGLVFHGDLLAVPDDGTVKPASPRTRGLAEAVKARGLTVSSYVGAWPLHGYQTVVSAAQLERALELAREQRK
jgi:glyoxylase-like metal-dependent hydrolase (beta-lactamase superfamily II)